MTLLHELSPEGLTSVIHSFSWFHHLPSIQFLTAFTDQVALKSATLSQEAHLGIARILKRFMAKHEKASRLPRPAVQASKKQVAAKPQSMKEDTQQRMKTAIRCTSLSFKSLNQKHGSSSEALFQLQESIISFGNRSFVFEEPTQNAQPTNPVEITEQWQMESSDIAPPFDFDPTFDD